MAFASAFRSTGNNFHAAYLKSLESNSSTTVENPSQETNSDNQSGANLKNYLQYNGFPEIQNTDEGSKYYFAKPISAQSSVKHGLNFSTGAIGDGATGGGSRTEIPSRSGSSFMRTGSEFFNPGSTGGFLSRGSFQIGRATTTSAQGKRTGTNSRGSTRNVRFVMEDNSTTE